MSVLLCLDNALELGQSMFVLLSFYLSTHEFMIALIAFAQHDMMRS